MRRTRLLPYAVGGIAGLALAVAATTMVIPATAAERPYGELTNGVDVEGAFHVLTADIEPAVLDAPIPLYEAAQLNEAWAEVRAEFPAALPREAAFGGSSRFVVKGASSR